MLPEGAAEGRCAFERQPLCKLCPPNQGANPCKPHEVCVQVEGEEQQCQPVCPEGSPECPKDNECVDDVQCDDGNACTKDSCENKVCHNVAIDCEDGARCTRDVCVGGTCTHVFEHSREGKVPGERDVCKPAGPCVVADDCKAPSDCHEAKCVKRGDQDDQGRCVFSLKADRELPCDDDVVVPCPSGKDEECRVRAEVCYTGKCDANTKQCVFERNEDAKETCKPEEPAKCVLDHCDDGNACTRDVCDLATNTCKNVRIRGCNGCVEDGDCQDDGLACTQAQCVNGKCAHVCANGVEAGACERVKCVAGADEEAASVCATEPLEGCVKCENAADCDDNKACTTDVCSPKGECVYRNECACPDGNTACPCNQVICDDKDACTRDECTPEGCKHTNVCGETKCPDGTVCKGESACAPAVCAKRTDGEGYECKPKPGGACDDGDECTKDVCLPNSLAQEGKVQCKHIRLTTTECTECDFHKPCLSPKARTRATTTCACSPAASACRSRSASRTRSATMVWRAPRTGATSAT